MPKSSRPTTAETTAPASASTGGFVCDSVMADIDAIDAEFEARENPPARAFRLHRRTLGGFEGVGDIEYKPAEAATAQNWARVVRREIVGNPAPVPDPANFHLRHFEVAPGGFSSFEKHQHIHAVIVERGMGEVQINDEVFTICPGDVVYVGPMTPHQFRCPAGAAMPLGFFCIVDATRDRPIPVAMPPAKPKPAAKRAAKRAAKTGARKSAKAKRKSS